MRILSLLIYLIYFGSDKQLGVAIIHALNARRGRQICFGIFLIIVIALGLGLGIYYGYVLPKAQGH